MAFHKHTPKHFLDNDGNKVTWCVTCWDRLKNESEEQNKNENKSGN